VAILGLFFFIQTDALAYVFNRNLTIGSEGEDVRQLQMYLNSNPTTKLANLGVGSPGQETTYFGNLTKTAIIKYQNLFRTEILTPVGLISGTGYFGLSTRTKLNSTEVGQTKTTETKEIQQTKATPQLAGLSFDFPENHNQLILAFAEPYEGPTGTRITLSGAGFEKNNTVYFDDQEIEVSSKDTTSLTFNIPDIPNKKYAVEVKNSKGKSDTDTFFIVKDPSTKPPIITSISPKSGFYGETVEVTGVGFQTKDNEIRTSYGVVPGIPSKDGKTLTFEVSPFPETPGIQEGIDLNQGVSWEISFYILNDNGVSNRATFTLKF